MNAEGQWNVYRTRFLVRARKLAEPLLFIDALGREQAGQAGDYLVESSDGLRRIAPRIIFEDIYVPLDSPPLPPSGPRPAQPRSGKRRVLLGPKVSRSNRWPANEHPESAVREPALPESKEGFANNRRLASVIFPTRYLWYFRATIYRGSLLTGPIYGSTLSIHEQF